MFFLALTHKYSCDSLGFVRSNSKSYRLCGYHTKTSHFKSYCFSTGLFFNPGANVWSLFAILLQVFVLFSLSASLCFKVLALVVLKCSRQITTEIGLISYISGLFLKNVILLVCNSYFIFIIPCLSDLFLSIVFLPFKLSSSNFQRKENA
ncbi:hypothetical protein HPP92_003599 [Vanilla planifolia]|uniref:Uncharacterized protein n=1 Tax=Vanilla planifolia TaxID=51239 RepID=A0A835VJ21_VANPL|nr:hypothetical protein HPP92_003599 [Vanilla planifolia]